MSLSAHTMLASQGFDVEGIARTFTYQGYEHCYIAFYVFMFLWIQEVFVALSQFTLIYTTVVWYFTPYRGSSKVDLPLTPLTRGLRIGVMYHLGSLAFGAFLVAVLRMLRLIAALLQ